MKTSLAQNSFILETTEQIEGVRVGKITRVDEGGQVFVDFPGNIRGPISARFTSSVKLPFLRRAADAGQEVLLAFEDSDRERPIIVDTLFSLLEENSESSGVALEAEKPEDVFVDGKRVFFDAREEIVLRCGKASITLRTDGKIILKGTYLLSRSSGINKIKGGAVHIN
jgi:hypothetical protein